MDERDRIALDSPGPAAIARSGRRAAAFGVGVAANERPPAAPTRCEERFHLSPRSAVDHCLTAIGDSTFDVQAGMDRMPLRDEGSGASGGSPRSPEPGAARSPSVSASLLGSDEEGNPYPSFEARLAHAMQGVAEREFERIRAHVTQSASSVIEKARGRAEAEAEDLHVQANEDIDSIYERSQAQIMSIREQSGREIIERRERFDRSLTDRTSILESEIEGIRREVEAYRGSLEAFLARLRFERDPVEIARLADTLPGPPDLQAITPAAAAVPAAPNTRHAAAPATPSDSDPGSSNIGISIERASNLIGVMHPALMGRRRPDAASSDNRVGSGSATGPSVGPDRSLPSSDRSDGASG